MTAKGSKILGKVLGELLKDQYPQLPSSDQEWITLDVLLEWTLWPMYLTVAQEGVVDISLI